MFRGFELKMGKVGFIADYDPQSNFKTEGNCLKAAYQKDFGNRLQTVTEASTGIIDGNEIEDAWFPQFPGHFHVFLSHSHADENLAVAIAGLLKRKLDLDVFVDSLVWDFKDELIRKFYRLGDQTWSRLVSICSHVDCMLMKSLIEMIDSCECLLFLNTPKSVTVENAVKQTYSPWIYAELEASRFLRLHQDETRKPLLLKENFGDRSKQASAEFKVAYRIPNHLTKLSTNGFSNWMTRSRDRKGFDALDILYELTPDSPRPVRKS